MHPEPQRAGPPHPRWTPAPRSPAALTHESCPRPQGGTWGSSGWPFSGPSPGVSCSSCAAGDTGGVWGAGRLWCRPPRETSRGPWFLESPAGIHQRLVHRARARGGGGVRPAASRPAPLPTGTARPTTGAGFHGPWDPGQAVGGGGTVSAPGDRAPEPRGVRTPGRGRQDHLELPLHVHLRPDKTLAEPPECKPSAPPGAPGDGEGGRGRARSTSPQPKQTLSPLHACGLSTRDAFWGPATLHPPALPTARGPVQT